jgi:LacI family transcriptional regulator
MTTVTIKHVAARAGVSPKTVSRVINGEAHVRAEVREQVLRVVAEMDYRPNAFARGLSSSRAFLIGLFFDDPASGYAADIQRGALAQCRALSHHLVVEPVDLDQADWRERLVSTLREIRLGGAILTPPICDSQELIDVFLQHDVPVVRIAPGDRVDRTPRVYMDDRAAARAMTERLIALGHRAIGFVKGKASHSASALRHEGFREAMAAAGLPVRDAWILDGDFSFRAGFEAAEAMLPAADRPTAIFASNDEMALGVLVGAIRHRVAVPDSLSIAGFDDAPIARMAWPQIVTIRQPNVEIAAAAVDILVGRGRANGDGKRCFELPFALVDRPSIAPARP